MEEEEEEEHYYQIDFLLIPVADGREDLLDSWSFVHKLQID